MVLLPWRFHHLHPQKWIKLDMSPSHVQAGDLAASSSVLQQLRVSAKEQEKKWVGLRQDQLRAFLQHFEISL